MFRLVLLQRNGLLVSIQHLLGEMLCRVAGGGGQSVLVQLPAQGGIRDDGVQCRCKLGFVLPLPAVEAVSTTPSRQGSARQSTGRPQAMPSK